MAWNEPGGGNNNNPWGNNGNKNDGPPDLDQVFKKFQEKLGAAFGGNGNKPGSGNSTPAGFGAGIGFLLVLAVFAYGVLGFFTVAPYEKAVITRLGKYDRTVGEGLHWAPKVVDRVKHIDTEKLRSSLHSGWMLTRDENILKVEVEVHYRVVDAEKYLFNIQQPDVTLRQAADSALRQVIGESFTDDVLTEKKQQISESVKEQLTTTLKFYDSGFYVTAVNFKDSRPPDEVKDAFDDVTRSREDRERLKLQADAYYNKIVPEAEGRAKKMILEAEAYRSELIFAAQGEADKFNLVYPEYSKAPKVTQTRLYLDAVEHIMENSSKMLVDVGNANNFIYLPVDKLLASSDQKSSSNNTSAQLSSEQSSQPRLISNNDTDRMRSRRRKGDDNG